MSFPLRAMNGYILAVTTEDCQKKGVILYESPYVFLKILNSSSSKLSKEDEIFFKRQKLAGCEIKYEEYTFYAIHEDDVIAVKNNKV